MKNFRYLLTGLALALILLSTGASWAQETVQGKVKFLRTIPEEAHDGGFSARLQVIVEGTCGANGALREFGIIIRSGHMDGIVAHNSVNMRNAYSTLLAAYLSGTGVIIGGLQACDPVDNRVPHIDLWTGEVGLARK